MTNIATQTFPNSYRKPKVRPNRAKNAPKRRWSDYSCSYGAKWPKQPKMPLKPRKPLRRVSLKQAKRLREYNHRVREWKIGKVCQVCFEIDKKWVQCDDCHHQRGRVASLLMDERYWVPLCRFHHSYVENHPDWARKHGFLCEKGMWNKA